MSIIAEIEEDEAAKRDFLSARDKDLKKVSSMDKGHWLLSKRSTPSLFEGSYFTIVL